VFCNPGFTGIGGGNPGTVLEVREYRCPFSLRGGGGCRGGVWEWGESTGEISFEEFD